MEHPPTTRGRSRGSTGLRVLGTVSLMVLGVLALRAVRGDGPPGGEHAARVPRSAPGESKTGAVAPPSPERPGTRAPGVEPPTPKSSLSPAAAEDGLEVLVTDASGRPVPDARLHVIGVGQDPVRSESSTDTKGRAILMPSSPRPVEIVASHPVEGVGQGWALPGADLLRISLDALRISGRVHLADGGPPGHPVDIVALPRRLALAPEGLEELLARPEVILARSEPSGEFVLEGLPREPAGIVLVCGARGLVAPRPVLCRGGEDDVSILLLHAYGALLNIECSGPGAGEALELLDRTPRGLLVLGSPEPGAEQLPPRSPAVLLAGMPEGLEEQDGRLLRSYVFASRTDAPRLGSCQVLIDAPGLGPDAFSVEFTHLGLGLVTTDILLRPAPGPTGSIRVVDRGGTLLVPDPMEHERLELELRSGSRASTFTLLRPDGARSGDPEALVNGIPHGEYEARLRRSPALARHPVEGWIPLTVGPEPATIEIPAGGGHGDLWIEFLDPEGLPYLGAVGFHLSRSAPESFEGSTYSLGGGRHGLTRGPHRLSALLPGTWYVRMHFPHLSDAVPAEVVAGEARSVRVPTRSRTSRPVTDEELAEALARRERFFDSRAPDNEEPR